MVRYCEVCRKQPGASGYLKQGFLFEEYLAHCEDEEYVRLLRERFGGVRRGVGKVVEQGQREGGKGRGGKKEREQAERVREVQDANKREFWRDLEGLQRERKRGLRGKGVDAAAGNGEHIESRPKGFLDRLRSRSDRDAGGSISGGGRPGSVVGREQSLKNRRDSEGVNVDEYDSDETVTPGRASTVSSLSSLSSHSSFRPSRGFRWAPTP